MRVRMIVIVVVVVVVVIMPVTVMSVVVRMLNCHDSYGNTSLRYIL